MLLLSVTSYTTATSILPLTVVIKTIITITVILADVTITITSSI